MYSHSPVVHAFFAAHLLSIGALAAQDTRIASADWPQFRGAHALGIDDSRPLPTEWSLDEGKNVRWRVAVPGLAHSSPIVVGGRVFVTTAVARGLEPELKVGLYGAGDSAKDMVEHAFQVHCFDAASGALLWVRTSVIATPKFARHTKATHADPSPASDGSRIVAVFGAQGMYGYDLDGQQLWKVDLGELDVGPHNSLDLQWGYASSPIVADGKVIVQQDVKKSPSLAAFDVKTGAVIWRVARSDVPGWCTPTAHRTSEGLQVLVNGCKHIGAYDAKDGTELWRMAGGGGIPVPAPVAVDGRIYLTSNHRPIQPGHPLKPIFVVKDSARGDLGVPTRIHPGEHLAWMTTSHGSYMQTPMIYRGRAYFGKTNGVVSIFDAKSGERQKRGRLGAGTTGFSASPVAGDGKVYFTSEEGEVYVLRAGPDLEVLAVNQMGEVCMATPAVAGGCLFFRTRGHLVCVGSE